MNRDRTTTHLAASNAVSAGRILRDGGLVVFPTETVYGLGANALDGRACAAIFRAKGRPGDNPLIVHFPDLDSLVTAFPNLPPTARQLFDLFSPGPLSVIVPKACAASGCHIADEATAGLATVALRIPRHPVAREFLRSAGVPVAAPSANRSGRPSPTSFQMACAEMDGLVDAVVDGGPCEIGLESTVVDISRGTVRILRHGAVTNEMIEQTLGPNWSPQGGPGVPDHEQERPLAPGMKYAHYKPRARVVVADNSVFAAPEFHPAAVAGRYGHRAGSVGVIRCGNSTEISPDLVNEADGVVTVFVANVAAYARGLYRLLVWFDANGIEFVIAELPEAIGVGTAVRDRLLRASGGEQVRLS